MTKFPKHYWWLKLKQCERAKQFENISHLFWVYSVFSKKGGDLKKICFQKTWSLTKTSVVEYQYWVEQFWCFFHKSDQSLKEILICLEMKDVKKKLNLCFPYNFTASKIDLICLKNVFLQWYCIRETNFSADIFSTIFNFRTHFFRKKK